MSFFRSKKPIAAPTELPVPLAVWFMDQASVLDLRDMLASKAFQKAIATLQAAANPSGSALTNDTTTLANKFVWLSGYYDAFRDLQKLTKLPEPTAEADEEWGYINEPQRPSNYTSLDPE